MHKRLMLLFVFVSLVSLSLVSAGVGGWFRDTFGAPLIDDVRLSPGQVTVTAIHYGRTDDMTAPWSFAAGSGPDFEFGLQLSGAELSSPKVITSLRVDHTAYYEWWTTNSPGSYPIVGVLAGGTKIATTYTDNLALSVQPGAEVVLSLYIQPATVPFNGGVLTIRYADGTSQTVALPKTISSKPVVCSADYAPVCGANGNTYSNACQATVAGTTASCTGSCPCPISPPVLGYSCVDSDGTNASRSGNVTVRSTTTYTNGTVLYGLPSVTQDSCAISTGQGAGIDYATEATCESSMSNAVTLQNIPCVNGCVNGRCLDAPVSTATCTDSDGGLAYYLKGKITGISEEGTPYSFEDKCTVDGPNAGVLQEYDCTIQGISRGTGYNCPNGCSEGACLPQPPQACSELIAQVKEPKQTKMLGETEFTLSWNSSYDTSYWVNGSTLTAQEYHASWYGGVGKEHPETNEWTYANQYISQRVAVFDDRSFDARLALEDSVTHSPCIVQDFWLGEEKPSPVYVCNYNILQDTRDQYGQVYEGHSLFWAHDNVLLNIYVSNSESLTREEQAALDRDLLYNTLRDLKSNEFKYNLHSNFDVEYPLSADIVDVLRLCPSTLSSNVKRPYLSCRLEPTFCPPHGVQTQTCIDLNGNTELSRETRSCSPGMCSGCMVPQWFGNVGGPNKCIPYGFRVEAESGTRMELVSGKESGVLFVGDESKYLTLDVISDEKAILTFYGATQNFTYTLVPGASVDITEALNDLDDDGETNVKFYVEDIDVAEQKVVFVFSYQQEREVVDTYNAYCDIDGQLKEQKVVNYEGDWATCQNNYECTSNVCSSGECIEVQSLLKEVSGFKTLAVKALCRITNLFDNDGHNQCLSEYLSLPPPIVVD